MDAHILVFTIACAFTATLVATAPERQKRELKCDSQADIVFLLDSSGSVSPSNFQIMLQFVKGVVKNFEIGPNNVQIGVIKFGSSITTEFQLNTYSDGSGVDAAVSRIMYIGGGTPTGGAIRLMRTNSFTSAQGDRPSVPNIGIVVTDGISNNPTETALEAKQSRDAGVVMLAVGVGGYRQQELNDIATDPDSDHVFEARTFDSLAGIIDRLSNKACEDTTPPTLNCSSAVYIEFPSENDAPYQYDPSGFATTNEGMLMAKPSSFEVGPPAVGGDTKTVEFTAKDRSGNSATCSVAFNIQDTTPPVLKCPTNVILEVICKTNETIDSRDYVTTNEGVLTSNVTALTIGIANVGASVPIEITAKDRHGNTESCVVTFTVSDPCEMVSTSTCQKGTPCGPLGNKYPNCGSGHLCCPCTVGAPGNGQGNRPTHFCNVDPSCPAQDKKQNGPRKPPA